MPSQEEIDAIEAKMVETLKEMALRLESAAHHIKEGIDTHGLMFIKMENGPQAIATMDDCCHGIMSFLSALTTVAVNAIQRGDLDFELPEGVSLD